MVTVPAWFHLFVQVKKQKKTKILDVESLKLDLFYSLQKSTLLFKTYVIFHLEIKGFSLSTAKDPSWPSLAQLNCLSSAVPEFEETENDPEVVNLVQYTTLGGVFYYDLLQLPPQPIRRKGYTILQVIRIGFFWKKPQLRLTSADPERSMVCSSRWWTG